MFQLKHRLMETAPESAPVPPTSDPYAGGSTDEPAQRPEHIPEKFWDTEKGEVRMDDVFKSYGELESKLGQRRDEVAAEVRQSLREGVPAEAAAYLVEPEKLELPEHVEWDKEAESNDPLLSWWRETAYKMGLDNDGFNEGVRTYLASAAAGAPNPEAIREELGENGAARVEAVNGWLESNLDAETFEMAKEIVDSADHVRLIEAILDKSRQTAMAGQADAGGDTELTKKDVEEMMRDPQYWHPVKKSPAYIQKVQDAWGKLAAAGKLD